MFTPEKVRAMAAGSARPTGGQATTNPLPAEIWPVYSQALEALRLDFRHRGDGAVLVHRRDGLAETEVRWRTDTSGTASERQLADGGMLLLYLPAGEGVEFEWGAGETAVHRDVTARLGEVICVEMAL